MPASEVVLLRREMHKMAREHARAVEGYESRLRLAGDENRGLLNAVTDLRAENRDLKNRLAFYENAHTPPSVRKLPANARRGENSAGAPVKPERSPGRKPGHRGSRAPGAPRKPSATFPPSAPNAEARICWQFQRRTKTSPT